MYTAPASRHAEKIKENKNILKYSEERMIIVWRGHKVHEIRQLISINIDRTLKMPTTAYSHRFACWEKSMSTVQVKHIFSHSALTDTVICSFRHTSSCFLSSRCPSGEHACTVSHSAIYQHACMCEQWTTAESRSLFCGSSISDSHDDTPHSVVRRALLDRNLYIDLADGPDTSLLSISILGCCYFRRTKFSLWRCLCETSWYSLMCVHLSTSISRTRAGLRSILFCSLIEVMPLLAVYCQ